MEQIGKQDFKGLFFMLIQLLVDLYHTIYAFLAKYYSNNSKQADKKIEAPKKAVNKRNQFARKGSSNSEMGAFPKRRDLNNPVLNATENNAEWYNNYDYPFDDGWKCQIF